MTDDNRPRTDEEFVNHENIRFSASKNWGKGAVIYSYGVPAEGEYVNIEFMSGDPDRDDLVDAYFYPEDLERLGIMFQYLGKTARKARDGTT